ncbi:MAG: helix-turn-helix domain-containing protein [Clostridiales bacterium]|nr:helix-turn-helix domain-containing protein [Clostridiales bacterium]
MTDIDFTAFQNNLRALIDARGRLIKDVAADVNVTPATMSRYLSGARDPDLKYVVRLAEYFSVSVDWLLGLNGEKFDVLPQEIQDFAELYSLASPDDRRVVQAVLSKYLPENRPNICGDRS